MTGDESFTSKLGEMIALDALLSIENAAGLVAAVAALPPKQRNRVLALGIALAIGFRLAMGTFFASYLHTPGLKFAAGAALVPLAFWLIHKVNKHIREDRKQRAFQKAAQQAGGHTQGAHHPNPASGSQSLAIGKVVLFDLFMSFDNVIGLAGIANGNLPLLWTGIGASAGMLWFGTRGFSWLFSRAPQVAWLGGLFLVKIGLEMMAEGAASAPSGLIRLEDNMQRNFGFGGAMTLMPFVNGASDLLGMVPHMGGYWGQHLIWLAAAGVLTMTYFTIFNLIKANLPGGQKNTHDTRVKPGAPLPVTSPRVAIA